MLEDDIRIFIINLFRYLFREKEYIPNLSVKKHDVNLQEHGDFSFLNTAKSWQEFLNCEQFQNSPNVSLLKCINKDLTNFVETSQNWDIPIVKAIELNERIHLFIDRFKAIRICFRNASINDEFISQKLAANTDVVKLDSNCKDENCITYLRLKILRDAVRNLYMINNYDDSSEIVLTWKSNCYFPDKKTVFCGTVLNAKTGSKENTITADEYIRLRQNELTLIAKHKCGVRVSKEGQWTDFMASLGESAVIFELLQTRCSSPVKINFDVTCGSSKGPAFVLYNCARLEAILKTFHEKVAEGVYPQLPTLDNTDLNLLTDEGEWSLIFNFIMVLPSLLDSCSKFNEEKWEFRPHMICNFLSIMVKTFSQYYRRVRILTEPRKHLLPVLFARIHMLIKLNITLKTCLRILNIKSVSQMY